MRTPRRYALHLLCRMAFLALGASLSAAPMNSGAVKRLFANPPREFSSAPLWVWNDLLSEQEIISTLRDLSNQQVKQVIVHPRPGLMTPYLGADWFRLWNVALKEARMLNMNVWIYDENSYPSGFAGGLVPELMPEARGRGLVFKKSQRPPKWDVSTLAVFQTKGDSFENVTETARAGVEMPANQDYIVVAVERAPDSPWHGGRCYVDLIYPGVTEKFLDLTLGAYQSHIGREFGKRVPGIFTDEPNIRPAGGLPWTDDLPAQFRKRWGYDLESNLCSLQFETGDWQRVRHNYYSILNELFVERWAKPYGARCQKLGLEMTGHYWEHDWPVCSGVPDNMSMYAWEQRPAIDCLMNQYAEHTHAQFGNIRSVRELGSIANQLGKKRTLCEVYGAGGWDLRFEDMKRQADWLAVLGVNTFDQHLSYVTIRGARKRDHPQSFSYHEPWWEAYHACGAYLERLSVAASQGEAINRILVIEPTSTAWIYQGNEPALQHLGDSFFNLLKSLEAAQVEYDLGCEDVMARHGSSKGGQLKVGQRTYEQVVIPPACGNLNGSTWDLLHSYTLAGGKVIVCQAPGAERKWKRDGGPATNGIASAIASQRWQFCDPKDLPAKLSPELKSSGLVFSRDHNDKGTLFHMRRRLADGELLFLVNTSIEFPSTGSFDSSIQNIERWDLESGKTSSCKYERTGQGTRARFELPPCGSLLFFLSKRAGEPAEDHVLITTTCKAVGPMEILRSEPNVLILDYVDIRAGGETRTNLYFYQASQFAFQKNGMERNPWDSAVQFKNELVSREFPTESGFEARYRFTIEDAVPPQLFAVVERPDLYRIMCNGQLLSSIPGSWWLDKAFGRLDLAAIARVGLNEIVITAAPFKILDELEPIYILGDFSLKSATSGFHIVSNCPLQLGPWNTQGHPFYAAGVAYRQRFDLVDSPLGRYMVCLNSWYGSVAKVVVNGHLAGYIGYQPWKCDVTKWIQGGENTVEVTAIGTLKNTLGPHHGKPARGSAWPGMFQKAPSSGPPAGDAYDTIGYGLFEPFALQRVGPRNLVKLAED